MRNVAVGAGLGLVGALAFGAGLLGSTDEVRPPSEGGTELPELVRPAPVAPSERSPAVRVAPVPRAPSRVLPGPLPEGDALPAPSGVGLPLPSKSLPVPSKTLPSPGEPDGERDRA